MFFLSKDFQPSFADLILFFLFMYVGIILLIIWSLFWKFKALWRAAKRNEKKWFLVLLLVNTVGILEILYLRIWGKENPEQR